MAQVIDPERLVAMRKRRGWSQAQLAVKAKHPDNPKTGLNKNTVYRLEKGKCPPQKGTVERLAKALEVDPEVLTGAKPLPEEVTAAAPRPEDAAYPVPGRVSPAIRNAYELTARRYGVSVPKIAQLAPLMFAILAEASLRHRSHVVDECRAKADEFRAAAAQLPDGIFTHVEDEISAEEDSIAKNDVFGRRLWKVAPDNWDRDNPFATYIGALAARFAKDDITVNAVGATSTDYRVCRSAAVALTYGDEELAASLLIGEIVIHRMPRGYTAEQRLKWMQDHKNLVPVLTEEVPDETPEQIPPNLVKVVDI